MLPFLRRAQDVGVAVPSEAEKREPDGEKEEFNDLHMVMDELIAAVKAGDRDAAAMAFEAAFQICESYPHEEGGA